MTTNGTIYLLVNPTMPGLVKVGKTTTDADTRAGQLSASTGVAAPFRVVASFAVQDCHASERLAHEVLERVFGRPNPGREFFSADPSEAAAILEDLLRPHLVVAPGSRDAELKSSIARVTRKEFTIACAELEQIFTAVPLSVDHVLCDSMLHEAAAAYLASCYGSDRTPAFRHILLSTSLRSRLLERAIEYAEKFEGNAAEEMIRFSRQWPA